MRAPPCARRPHARINESDAVRAAPGSPPRSGATPVLFMAASLSSRWLRSLRLGAASGTNRTRRPATAQDPPPRRSRKHPEKSLNGVATWSTSASIWCWPWEPVQTTPAALTQSPTRGSRRGRSSRAHRDRADPRRRDPSAGEDEVRVAVAVRVDGLDVEDAAGRLAAALEPRRAVRALDRPPRRGAATATATAWGRPTRAAPAPPAVPDRSRRTRRARDTRPGRSVARGESWQHA